LALRAQQLWQLPQWAMKVLFLQQQRQQQQQQEEEEHEQQRQAAQSLPGWARLRQQQDQQRLAST
jgi:hypothetical protein